MSITSQGAVAALPWAGLPPPDTPAGWLHRARTAAAVVAAPAVPGTGPDEVRRQVALLRSAGLVTLLGPAPQGGAGQLWDTAYQVVRRVAEVDAGLASLLGGHYLWSRLPGLLGTAGQAVELQATATREGWSFAGPARVGPGLVATDLGDDLSYSGSTCLPGREAADVVWLAGALRGGEQVVALAPSRHHAITSRPAAGDGPGRGPVTVRGVVLPWTGALGWSGKQVDPVGSRALCRPSLRLAAANVHLGAAAAGLGDVGPQGEVRSRLRQAERTADRAGEAVAELHLDPRHVSRRTRAAVAGLVATAQRRAVDVGRQVAALAG